VSYAAYHKCSNCGRDFADHNYVPDSVNKWVCPVKAHDIHYGYQCSPNFHPDFSEDSPIGVSVFEYETTFDPADASDSELERWAK
jgi:hypothetical protein